MKEYTTIFDELFCRQGNQQTWQGVPIDKVRQLTQDALRLDRLGDPKFRFKFAIKAFGGVELYEPVRQTHFNNLREAIDFARAEQKEIPFCINPQCRTPVNESSVAQEASTFRWICVKCGTQFLTPKDLKPFYQTDKELR